MRRELLSLVCLFALLSLAGGCTQAPAEETNDTATAPVASPAATAEPSPTPDVAWTRARVELDVFQDRPNPTWELSAEQTGEVMLGMFSGGYPPASEPPRCPSGSGYRGFIVTWIGDEKYLRGGPEGLRVCGGRIEMQGAIGVDAQDQAKAESTAVQDLDHRLEYFLLETAKPHIDGALYDSVRQEIARRTEPDDATPFAHSRIGRYELATDLPADLPTEAPVYPVVQGPVPDTEWARRLAGALGFTGDPNGESRAAAQPEWTWLGQERGLLTVDGNIAYQCSSPPAGATVASAPKDAEQAIAMVREWLTARDLLPADCADDVQAWPGTDGLGWEVRFRRRLDGLPVGNYWSWTGGLQVRLNSLGEVDFLTYLRHDVANGTPVPLRPVQQAWQELQERGPAFFDPEGSAVPPQYDVFTISEIGLGYYECCFAGTEVQEQLRPYFVFSGEASNSGQTIRRAAYVRAWK